MRRLGLTGCLIQCDLRVSSFDQKFEKAQKALGKQQ